MSETATSPEAAGADAPGAGGGEPAGYEGPGAWGGWAIGLMLFLFVLGAVATVHSFLVTLGG